LTLQVQRRSGASVPVRVVPLRFPNTIIAILAMPAWAGRLVLGDPGLDPADDILVQNARRARPRLVERSLDMRTCQASTSTNAAITSLARSDLPRFRSGASAASCR
jgi:hypothetical protein